ncbi:hypothetical protein ACFT5C_18295 [Streptomyces sp. NPDC057116]|uniref:hypothetical protein n=1 Tax=Streptomyces sp. NPDC057116 TaxID=3346023 RepID=UPI0036285960
MAYGLPEPAETDFTPVLARAEAVMVVDGRVRLRPAHAVAPYWAGSADRGHGRPADVAAAPIRASQRFSPAASGAPDV